MAPYPRGWGGTRGIPDSDLYMLARHLRRVNAARRITEAVRTVGSIRRARANATADNFRRNIAARRVTEAVRTVGAIRAARRRRRLVPNRVSPAAQAALNRASIAFARRRGGYTPPTQTPSSDVTYSQL